MDEEKESLESIPNKSHEIFLKIKAVPWAAPIITWRGAFDIRNKDKTFLRWQIKEKWTDKILSCPIELKLFFGFSPPKSTSKKKVDSMISGRAKHVKKPDVTNLGKLLEDCLKKICIEDDNQVFKISSEKYWATSDHIRIVIIEHEEIMPLRKECIKKVDEVNVSKIKSADNAKYQNIVDALNKARKSGTRILKSKKK